MRLEPLEKPPNLMMRVAYWMSRRQLGAVMSPLKVVYARQPKLARLGYRMAQVMEKGLSLDAELRLLITTQSSLQNGCGFCADLHLAQVVQARLGLEKFRALEDFATSPLFSDREKACLAYTGEATQHRSVGDATFENLRKHFSETEIVEITWLNAVGNYFNLIAVPLGLESDGLMEIALREAG
jgi:AhpD family alkylhydroperoxidase